MKRMQSDRDPRVDLGDQLRQDRHADPERDDRRADGGGRAAATPSTAPATRPPGTITRVAGQPRGGRWTSSCCRWSLASDAVISDGELIGDPTEGALVALAAKGGVDAVATRQAYPRIAELPFDADYKLMATFHRMTDRVGPGRGAVLRQGRPGSAARPRGDRVRRRRRAGSRRRRRHPAVPGREPAARRAGTAGHRHRPQGLRPCHLRPRRRPAAAGRRTWSCWRWSASSTRHARRRRRPSPPRRAPGSGSG